jgi:choice-of-anchor C domain-containing protein
MRRVFGVALFALLVSSSSVQANPILINGSFEFGPAMGGNSDVDVLPGSTSILGWTVFGTSASGSGAVDYMGLPWNVSDGVHAIDLAGRDATFSGLSQTFATTIGQLYEVSFDLSGNPQGGTAIKQMLVLVDSVSRQYSFDTTGLGISSLIWTPTSLLFKASSTSATLSFLNLSSMPTSYGAVIDNVSVVAVPEPASLLLISAGLLGLAAHRSRRHLIARSRIPRSPLEMP